MEMGTKLGAENTGCTCLKSQGGESCSGEMVGREKEEVNSCTVEQKEGGGRHSKVNDAGKDELEKKRKEQMYRGKMNFKRFFFWCTNED